MARPGLTTHPKFRRLMHELSLSKAHAWGHLECLWQPAYESGNAVIGDAVDVEIAADWQGESGKLAAALLKCRFIEETGDGRLQIHDLHANAPEYVRQRWSRELLRTEERTCVTCGETFRSGEPHAKFCSAACRQRSYRERNAGASQETPDSPLEVTHSDAGVTKGETHVTQRYEAPAPAPAPARAPINTRSNAARSPGKAKARAGKGVNPNHSRAVKLYVDRWAAKYGGEKYPFKHGKDAKAVTTILEHTGNDLDKFGAVVGRYLCDASPFFRGHALAKLASDIARFLTGPHAVDDDAWRGRSPSPAEIEAWERALAETNGNHTSSNGAES